MTYQPTENVDNYYQAKASPQSELMESTEEMNQRADYAVQAENQAVQEKTEKKLQKDETVDQKATEKSQDMQEGEEKKEEEKDPSEFGLQENIQEVGTAVVGAGIDMVEGIGATAEGVLTGQLLNPDFKPSWLQVNDDIEPQNKTVWGKMLRFAGEIGLGFLTTGGAGHLAKASKVPGLLQAGKFLTTPGATKAGAFARDAAKSAVVTFTNSHSEEENLSDALGEVLPWLPNPLRTTEDDTPLEKRAKAVVEDFMGGAILGRIFGFRNGVRAAKKIDKGQTIVPKGDPAKIAAELENIKVVYADMAPDSPEAIKTLKKMERLQGKLDNFAAVDPDVVSQGTEDIYGGAGRKAVEDDIQLNLELDPEITKPNPSMHPDYFDLPDKGMRQILPGSMYENMVDLVKMSRNGIAAGGRRARLISQANIKRISNGNADVDKYITELAKEAQEGFEKAAGFNVGGMEVTMAEAAQLSIARYIDIVDTFGAMSGATREQWDDISELLLTDAIQTKSVVEAGKVIETPNPINAVALEMLMSDTAAAVSDKATALLTAVDKIPIENALQQNLDNLEAALLMNQRASEFAGSLLRSRNWRNTKASQAASAAQSLDKATKIKRFMNEFRGIVKKDPEMAEAALRAFAASDGNAYVLETMKDFMVKELYNPGALLGQNGGKSMFLDQLFTTLYNSVLSAPKTLSRAFSGTGLLTVLRPFQTMAGGLIGGNEKMIKMGASQAFDLFDSIGEAWTLAKNTHFTNINGANGVSYNRVGISPTEQSYFKSMGKVIEATGTSGEKAVYRMTATMMDFNNQSWVQYPARFMNSIDTFFKTIVGRQELRRKAFTAAYDAHGGNVTNKMIKDYDSRFRAEVFSPDGNIIDAATSMAGQEVALQKPLTGRMAEISSFINKFPILKPFFLFMKTGVNALEVVQKHTPLLARFNGEVNDILAATADDLSRVNKYGIFDASQLEAAKAMTKGRIATGYMTVGAATGLYTTGRLSGNGPYDRELRNAWRKSGWQPRSIKFGDKWVSYDSLEPFSSILSFIADIGDHTQMMGEAWTENSLRKVSYLIAQNVTNKSFLSGLQPLTEMLSFDGARGQVWAANLANNFVPWSAARNELANIINPGMRELDQDFAQTIMNRNPVLRGLLPEAKDGLDGSVIKNWSFPERMWNSVMPIQLGTKDTRVRRMLRDTGYDLAVTYNTDSFGNRLTPEQRSKMAEYMGDQNIEAQLGELLDHPQIQEEMKKYRALRRRGVPGTQKDDPNNLPIERSLTWRMISDVFRRAKSNAEVMLFRDYPDLQTQGYRRDAIQANQKRGDTQAVENLLNMNK